MLYLMRVIAGLAILALFCGCLGQENDNPMKTFSNQHFSFDYPKSWSLTEKTGPSLSAIMCGDKERNTALTIMWRNKEADLEDSVKLVLEGQDYGFNKSNPTEYNTGEFTETSFKGNKAFIQKRTAKYPNEQETQTSHEGETIIFNCNGRHFIIMFDKPVSETEIEGEKIINTLEC